MKIKFNKKVLRLVLFIVSVLSITGFFIHREDQLKAEISEINKHIQTNKFDIKGVYGFISTSEKRRILHTQITNYVNEQNSQLDKDYVYDIVTYILDYSELYDVDPVLLTSVIHTESHFNKELTSPVGAKGLGQIMPMTAKFLMEDIPYLETDLFDPKLNIRLTAKYLAMANGMYNQNMFMVLAEYNGGPRQAYRILEKKAVPETMDYVYNKVIPRYNRLSKRINFMFEEVSS